MSLSDVLDVLVPGGFILLVLALIFIKNPSPGEVTGFEPRSSAAECPPRSSRRSRPVDPEVVLPAPLGPGRVSSRSASDGAVSGGAPNLARNRIVGLDDGQLRHGFEWRERERGLRGDA